MITPADSAPTAPEQMPASTWDIQSPYAAGVPGRVNVHGDNDAGGGDKTSGTVAGSIAEAMARQAELAGDTGQGSVIGDLMTLPANPGGFYDPPRDYGATP